MREEQGGPWPIAYLVSKEMFLGFFYSIIQRISSSEILHHTFNFRLGWSVVGQVQAIVLEQTDQVAWFLADDTMMTTLIMMMMGLAIGAGTLQ